MQKRRSNGKQGYWVTVSVALELARANERAPWSFVSCYGWGQWRWQ
jgi:hypothetical protein